MPDRERKRERERERKREERPQAFDGCLRSLAVGKEASLKLGGPRPLFEGYGPLGRQKGVQQQEKKQVSS